MAQRALLLLLSLAVLVVLGLGLASVELERSAARDASAKPLTPAGVADARRKLHRADSLMPDNAAQVRSLELSLLAGERGRAFATARVIAREEPENIEAWIVLSRFAPPDSALAAKAAQRLRELRRL